MTWTFLHATIENRWTDAHAYKIVMVNTLKALRPVFHTSALRGLIKQLVSCFVADRGKKSKHRWCRSSFVDQLERPSLITRVQSFYIKCKQKLLCRRYCSTYLLLSATWRAVESLESCVCIFAAFSNYNELSQKSYMSEVVASSLRILVNFIVNSRSNVALTTAIVILTYVLRLCDVNGCDWLVFERVTVKSVE